jgi:Mn-dependent DtxR family transcriptional regulator
MITTRIDTSTEHLNKLISRNGFQNAEELAQHLGVHWTTVYRWLRGQGPVPVVVIRYLELKAKAKAK